MTSKLLKLKCLGVSSLILLLAACYPDKEAVQELYDRQTALEARLDKLADDLESSMARIETDIKAVESGQTGLAREIESMRVKNVTLKRKIEKVATSKPPKKGETPDEKKKSAPENSPEFIYDKAVKSYNEGKFEDAILEYQRLIDTYPRDKRVPEAYLRQGMALINLGRNKEAKFFFNALIDKYPNSEEARTAREKLNMI